MSENWRLVSETVVTADTDPPAAPRWRPVTSAIPCRLSSISATAEKMRSRADAAWSASCAPRATSSAPAVVATDVAPMARPTSSIKERTSPVARAARSASLRTSSATTAKPLPSSPARAASMVALRARRLV